VGVVHSTVNLDLTVLSPRVSGLTELAAIRQEIIVVVRSYALLLSAVLIFFPSVQAQIRWFAVASRQRFSIPTLETRASQTYR